jgi:hypothetical protein
MRLFEVTSPFVLLNSGRIRLTDKQYTDRAHALGKTDDVHVYTIEKPVGFKHGEVFEYDGELTPTLAKDVKAAEESLQETPDATFTVKDLAEQLGLNVKQTLALLRDKFALVLNAGRDIVPLAIVEQALDDEESTEEETSEEESPEETPDEYTSDDSSGEEFTTEEQFSPES